MDHGGALLPGERLKIRNVAADMGVGQMPVRAALQRLAAEGALINVPNAGVTVPRLSLPEFDDLMQMRLLLEGEAASAAACGWMRRKLPPCKAGAPTWPPPCKRVEAKRYLDINDDFHVML